MRLSWRKTKSLGHGNMQHYIYQRTSDCWKCGFCTDIVACPSPENCIGCQSCFLACFREAIEPVTNPPGPPILITVDEQSVSVPSKITIKAALESLGFQFSRFPNVSALFAPCQTGGCHACTVLVNGEPKPSCHTPIQPNQNIQTRPPENIQPRRIVGWYTPHPVGGVGTPWTSKNYASTQGHFIEVACFTAGCNLRCRTCQNFDTTYNSSATAVTPEQAADQLTLLRRHTHVDRLAISGGEPTLNRSWLLSFFKTLRQRNSDSKARLHLDTNATLLTSDYIDDLIDCGVTDIGPDLKAVRLSTYQTITGISDSSLAQIYLETSWKAVKYLADRYYPEQVFVGVGLPYNAAFYTSTEAREMELHEWGDRLAAINDRIQVCILDYRPEFRRRDISRPSTDEIRDVKTLLEGRGLRTVIAQTRTGHLPPLDTSPSPGNSS